jgi:hypothetical protein
MTVEPFYDCDCKRRKKRGATWFAVRTHKAVTLWQTKWRAYLRLGRLKCDFLCALAVSSRLVVRKWKSQARYLWFCACHLAVGTSTLRVASCSFWTRSPLPQGTKIFDPSGNPLGAYERMTCMVPWPGEYKRDTPHPHLDADPAGAATRGALFSLSGTWAACMRSALISIVRTWPG